MALHQGGEGWLRNEEREPNSVPQRRLKQRTFIISAPGEAGSARSRCQRGCACPGGRGKKSVPRLPLAIEAALGVLLCVAVSGPLFFL